MGAYTSGKFAPKYTGGERIIHSVVYAVGFLCSYKIYVFNDITDMDGEENF